MPDGKIAMLDYGQVKHLDGKQRLLIARTVLAVLNKDEKAILQIYKETGYKSKYMNPYVMCKILVVVLDQDGSDVTDGI
jgi:predicted unusual protein kinase regulating ubiquinone biosynthesis (AarF/ABC1/UbiB family)